MGKKETTDVATFAILAVAGVVVVSIARATDRAIRWVGSVLFR